MGWPYEFLTLTDEEKQLRRQSLGFYARVAHISAFVPALVFLLIRLAIFLRSRFGSRERGYQAVPGSPAIKAQRVSGLGGLASRWTKTAWWMGDGVYFLGRRWGQRDEWVVGVSWALWLLVLCVVGTGKDYLHLTKRFGLIAVSQLPIQYLLSLKPVNPFAWIFLTSHEQLNRYHRVLGRVIYTLLILHIVFYNVFFLASGIWMKRFFAPVVREGVLASLLLHALVATALPAVRNWSYRLFYITHWNAAAGIPLLIFFHAQPSFYYLAEAILIWAVDSLVRRWTTVSDAPSTLEAVPGTNLIKIEATLPPSKIPSFQAHPGSHVFVRVPSASRPSQTWAAQYLWAVLRSPFTVSSVDPVSGTITIVARKRAGPLTSQLSALSSPSDGQGKPALGIDGPYGAVGKSLPSLLAGAYDRVLLFAGGVGATFALPIYRAVLHDTPAAHVRLIWAIRSAAEATWATSGSSGGTSVLDDDNVQLFLTGDMGVAGTSSDGVEMADLRRAGRMGGGGNRKRPDVGRIVDETFRKGLEESVAVLVCGPAEMARDVRESVRPWVMKGRRVWWHSEAFGW